MLSLARKLLFLLVSIALGWGLFRPVPPPDPLGLGDKLGHLLSFSVWSFSALLAFEVLRPGRRWLLLLVAGVVLEVMQHLVTPVRQLEFLDACANVSGVLIAVVAWWLLERWRSRRHAARAEPAPDDPR